MYVCKRREALDVRNIKRSEIQAMNVFRTTTIESQVCIKKYTLLTYIGHFAKLSYTTYFTRLFKILIRLGQNSPGPLTDPQVLYG